MATLQIQTSENWRRIIGAGVDVHLTNIENDGDWHQFDVIDADAEKVKTRLAKNGIDYEIAS